MKAKRLSRETTTEKAYLFNIEIRGGINGGKRKRGPPHWESPPLQGVLLLQTVPEGFNGSTSYLIGETTCSLNRFIDFKPRPSKFGQPFLSGS
jgi:hypothetical protein